jgi:hypothetical protein
MIGFIWHCLLFICLLSAGTTVAQTADETFRAVEQSIAKSDAQGLGQLLADQVEITIDKTEQEYPKAQAAIVLRDFFMNYPCRSFRILHKGNSADTHYAVGEYIVSRGNINKFDTNIFIKKRGNKFVIEQIRFEKE